MIDKEDLSKKEEEISLGAYLHHVRQQRGISLEKVTEKTKILPHLLKALEEDNYSSLPPSAFLKGMIRKYARFLKLDPEKVIHLYQKSNGRRLVSGKYDLPPQNRFLIKQFNIFPILKKSLLYFLRSAFFILLGIYFLYEGFLFLLPPRIILTSPLTDFSTSQAKLLLTGKVKRGKVLYLKDREIPLGADGSFQEEIILSPGLNKIRLRAINNLGKTTSATRNIIYNPK